MKIGIYDPYFDTLGGGEKYTLSVAGCLMPQHEVTIFWDDKSIIKQGAQRFNLDLENLKVEPNIFTHATPTLKRLLKSSRFDALFMMSDGSIPFLLTQKLIVHFQFPINWVETDSLFFRFKLARIKKIVCYSEFVKSFLDKHLKKDAIVIPPFVSKPAFSEGSKKENIILNVGRFTLAMNKKKQEVMIEVFKTMCDRGLKGWRLSLAGSCNPQERKFVEDLEKSIENYPIDIFVNITKKELDTLYNKAKIYWHATGFGENLEKHPEKAEHFGISTVEAMCARCVPVVISAGGQKEIVTHNYDGFLWNTKEELASFTRNLIENEKTLKKFSANAEQIVRKYSLDVFCREINKLFIES